MSQSGSSSVNISSIIVGARPQAAPGLEAQLAALAGVDVHAVAEDGRMLVTIEAPSDDATVNTLESIRQLPGVLSASLVYHRFESDPDLEA